MKQVEQEIIDIHALFQAWYNGELKLEDLEKQIGTRLSDDFYMVFPSAERCDKQELLALMRQDQGNDSDFRIEIRDIKIDEMGPNEYSATYQEWQYTNNSEEPFLKIQTTSLLHTKGDKVFWNSINEVGIE